MQTLNICRTWMNNKPISGLVTHLQVPGAGEEEEEEEEAEAEADADADAEADYLQYLGEIY